MGFLISLLFSVFFLTSCSTPKTESTQVHLPPERKRAVGTIAYNPDGVPDIIQTRRDGALKTIHENCGSNNYKIIREEDGPVRSEKAQDLEILNATKLHYIYYRCFE